MNFGPDSLYSSAKTSVKMFNAPLLAEYAASPGNLELPITPPILLILTTWDSLLKKGRSFWIKYATLKTLISKTE